MADKLKLMAVFAHPDDETLGLGGALAQYAAEGIETYLVCATRGERGWAGKPEENPGLAALGKTREAELKAAARVLGLREVSFLDYIDGDLDRAEPAEAIGKIATHLRRVRPQVVVTFAPDGAYGHPDHIAISQFTQAAVVCAADAGYEATAQSKPHRVSKLYYVVDSEEFIRFLTPHVGEITMEIDGVTRREVAWPEWAVTTRLDTGAHWQTVWKAADCHASQLAGMPELKNLDEEVRRRFWQWATFYRVYSLVNGGRRVEADLFEGLRED